MVWALMHTLFTEKCRVGDGGFRFLESVDVFCDVQKLQALLPHRLHFPAAFLAGSEVAFAEQFLDEGQITVQHPLQIDFTYVFHRRVPLFVFQFLDKPG